MSNRPRPRFRLHPSSAAMMLSVLLAGIDSPAYGASADFEVVPFAGHFRSVERVVYSPDGRWLISSGDKLEGTTRVWLDSRLRHVLQGTLAAISPDGITVATATEGSSRRSGAVRLWQVATGELLWEVASPTVSALAVTPDGAKVVAACDDGDARVWDLESGELRQRIEQRSSWLGKLALSSDGELAATTHKQIISLWEVDTGRHRCRLEGHGNMIAGLAFDDDDSYLASADHLGTVRIWDPATCETKTVLQASSNRLDDLALSPDGAYLLAAGTEGAFLWDVESRKLLNSHRIEGQKVTAVAFDRHGEWAAIGHLHGLITLLEPGAERPLRTLRSNFGLTWIEPSPEGDELATGHFGIDLIPLRSDTGNTRLPNFRQAIDGLLISDDAAQVVTQSYGMIRIWSLTTDRPPTELRGSRALASHDGAVVVVGDQQRSKGIKIWHRDSRMIREEVKHAVTITSFALAGDGTVLATGAADGTVRLWDTRTGELQSEVAGPSSVVHDVALVEGARAVAASYPDGSLWVWNVDASKPRRVLHHPELARTGHMMAVPSTSLLLTNVSNGGTYLWDLARGGIRRRLVEKFVTVDASAVTPDGRLALALSSQEEPGVWSTETGRVLFSLRGHRSEVDAIAVFDRGRQIVTGARDGTLGWWDAADGRLRQLLPLSRSGITAVAASPLGDFLLTADRDGAVRVRRAEDGEEIVRLLSSLGGSWAVVTPDGRWDAPHGGRDPGITVWSGDHHNLLADHRDRHAQGLLAQAMKRHVEANRRAPTEVGDGAASPEPAPEPTDAGEAAGAPAAEPWPRPPSPRDLEPSPRGVVRTVAVGSLTNERGSSLRVDGHRVAILRRSGPHSNLRIGDLSDLSRPRWLKNLKIPGYVGRFAWWRGFLYLTERDQLIVVDATEAENAREVDRLAMKQVSSVDAADGMAYLTAECEGLWILDLARPERPVVLPRGGPADAFGCLKAVAARGRYVYATASDSNVTSADSFFEVIDVSDPAAPTLAGRSIYSRGARRDVNRLVVEGSHAYLPAGDLGLLVFDVTNPSAPEQVARVDTPSLADVAVAGGRAYLADNYLGLQVLDVDTPSDPRYLGGDHRAPEAGHGPGMLAVLGEHLLVASHSVGIQILRVERP